MEHLQRAVNLDPKLPDGHNHYGMALAESGQGEAAVEQLQKAIELLPSSVEYRFNLGYVLESRGDYAGAVAPLEKAVELSEGKDWHCLAELARTYDNTGRSVQAVDAERKAVDLAVQEHNEELATNLRKILGRYEQDSAKAQNGGPAGSRQ
jgi:Flp pilus assembly protein TadD